MTITQLIGVGCFLAAGTIAAWFLWSMIRRRPFVIPNYQSGVPTPPDPWRQTMVESFMRLEQRVQDLEEIVNYINIKPRRFHHKRLPLPGERPTTGQDTTDDKWGAQAADSTVV